MAPYGAFLGALTRGNDSGSFQICPGTDCQPSKSLNLPLNQNLISTFCLKIWVFCECSTRPIPPLMIRVCYAYIVEWIRLAKLNWIFNYELENIWFVLYLLFLKWPNLCVFSHAFSLICQPTSFFTWLRKYSFDYGLSGLFWNKSLSFLRTSFPCQS